MTDHAPPSRPTRQSIRWSAVFGGTVIAVAFMAMLTALWVAIGYGNDVNAFSGYINWWVGGSAVAAALIAGGLAGWMSGAPSMAVGAIHGLTVWGLLVIAASVVGLPGSQVARVADSTLWTAFWTISIGMAAAVVGGLFGSAANRTTAPARGAGPVPMAADEPMRVSILEERLLLEEPNGTRELHITARR